MEVPMEPLTLVGYLEGWRIKVWDYAYAGTFKGMDVFKKSDNFSTFRGFGLAVKRVIYMYHYFLFKYKLKLVLGCVVLVMTDTKGLLSFQVFQI